MLSDIELLTYLLENNKKKIFTTSEIADHFSISQQTISRRLRELEVDGFIRRDASVRGTRVSLSSKGVSALRQAYAKLKKVFGEDNSRSIEGALVTGLGEGKYYLSLREYREQISGSFCFQPYPGTLNLRIDPEKLSLFLSEIPCVKIQGFRTSDRSYGELDAYRVKINDAVDGAIVIPKRTHHDPTIVEVVAPVSVREHFHLKDGGTVKLSR